MRGLSETFSRRLVLAAGAGALLAPAAAAHPAKTVLTTVEWNARNSSVEVIHRLHPHDAEIVLSKGGTSLDLGDPVQQARLMLYAEAHFVLSAGGEAIALEPVGVELRDVDAVVYREAKAARPFSELVVDDRMFRDVFDEQTNLVNIRMGKGVRTLIFAGRDGPKRARSLI